MGRGANQPPRRPRESRRASKVVRASRSKTNRAGRPTTRLAPSRKRARWQAVSFRAAIRAVTRHPWASRSSQTSPRAMCWAPWARRGSRRPAEADSWPGAESLEAPDDLQVQEPFGAPDAVDGIEQAGPAGRPRALVESLRLKLGAWPMMQAAESRTVPASISRSRLSLRVAPELVRSTMMSAIPRLGWSSSAPSEAITW